MKQINSYLRGLLIATIAAIPLILQFENTITDTCAQGPEKIKKTKKTIEQKMDAVEERWKFEFDLVKDPHTGKIPYRIREKEIEEVSKLPVKDGGDAMNTYTVLGPSNLGGRTRAFAYDKTDATIMLSGGVSSGMFRSTNSGANWTNVSPAGEIHNVTTLTQDPRTGSTTTWYYGTGEALGNSAGLTSAFYYGHGIYKSTNNGANWSKLLATTSTLETFGSPFDMVHRIVVDSSTGYVYAACQQVIERSTNSGTNWSIVLGTFAGSTSTGLTDIVCTRSGRLYASFSGTNASGDDGVWTSTTGASGSWTKIAGSGSGSTPAGWNASGSYKRVVLTLAPSNNDILYVLYDNATVNSCTGTPAPEADFFKWVQSTTTWTDRSATLPDEAGCSVGNDPFATQGGYDLLVAVKPDDENFVIIGGTNLYRSTDGFATTSVTTRIGGYAGTGGYTLYTDHHPDNHIVAFHPTNSTTMVSGDDGGIQVTTDVTASTVVWTSLNNDYITYQYYHVALDPSAVSMYAIGGAQDNGTTKTTGTSTHSSIFGGDGVSVGISTGNVYHYVGFQSGPIYRRLSTDVYGVGTDIKPTSSGSGIFVTYFHLNQDITEHLYYASSSSLYRTTTASTVTPGTWDFMSGISTAISGSGAGDIRSMATTRGAPYAGSHKLYIGTSGGHVFRVDDPAIVPVTYVPVDITAGLPGTGIVNGIAVDPTDDKKIMVVYSSYGLVSIWYTADASVLSPFWTSHEGGLTLPSIRSCAIVNRLDFPTEYYVGTSVGLFSTTALAGGGTLWFSEGPSTIKLAVVSRIVTRPADNGMLIGTHGNGMFYTTVSDPLPVEMISFTALVNRRDVTLNWATSQEINNSGFEIERCVTLTGSPPRGFEVWQKVAFVPGNGTTNNQQNYKYEDKNLNVAAYKYRLKQIDYNGNYEYHNLAEDVVVGIPNTFEMSQNYPNPSNPNSKIDYELPVSGKVTLKIYDILGREVIQIVNEIKEAGYYTAEFDGTNLASGIYFYRIISEGQGQKFTKTLKMVLVK